MHFACSKVYSSQVFLQELCCQGLISLSFPYSTPVFLFLWLTWQLIFLSINVGVVILSPEAGLCSDWCCRAFQTPPHPPENPHHVLKQQRAASSFSCWGLFFMAWVIGYILLALILSCIIFCTFFSFLFFKQQCYLKLLSLEYQLPECCSELIWTANVLFWKCAQLLLLFSDGEVLACDPGLQRYGGSFTHHIQHLFRG